jgi:hypothetical protein
MLVSVQVMTRIAHGKEVPPSLVPASGTSRGVRLARAALAATLSLPGVVRGHPGPHAAAVTEDGGCALTGVTVVASDAGRYTVELELAVRPNVATGLAQFVVQQVRQAVDDRGLGPYLERVSIAFADVGRA